MKVVVLLLCVVNLVVLGWLYTHKDDYQPRYEAQVNQLSPTIEKLLLLNERVVPEQVSSQTEQKPDEVPDPAEVTESLADAPVEIERPATDVQADMSASEFVESTETQAPRMDASPDTPEPTTLTEPPLPPARHCQTIGPFMTQENMNVLVGELKLLDVEAVQRTVQMQQPSGYWVFLPAMPNADARRIVDELAEKGVEDYFLGRQNFISLGIFSDKRTAESRLRDITELGYDAHLEPRYRTREVYWLDLEEHGQDLISEDRWQALLGKQADVRRQSLACE